jgi:kynureninase
MNAPLPWRDRFVESEPGLTYLKGNSLGRLPKAAAERADYAVSQEWGRRLVRGWNEGWFDLPERLGAKLAGIIGAKPHEVLVCDSTSINLFKLAVAAMRRTPDRPKLLSDRYNFPSDLYIFQGIRDILPGVQLGWTDLSEIPADTGLVSLSHVEFKSGRMHDGAAVTKLVQDSGALMLWDLSHSVGAVPVDLNGWDAALAVGCCYKYLNGGPGAPAFLYIREDLQEQLEPVMAGWFGHADPFEFDLEYKPKAGIRRFLVSTPPIVSMACVEAGIDLLLEAGMSTIRTRSLEITEHAISLFDEHLASLGFELATPREPQMRGSHLCVLHPEAYALSQALIKEENIVVDFRAPNALRFGIAPLYNDVADVDRLVAAIVEIVKSGRHHSYRARSGVVT